MVTPSGPVTPFGDYRRDLCSSQCSNLMRLPVHLLSELPHLLVETVFVFHASIQPRALHLATVTAMSAKRSLSTARATWRMGSMPGIAGTTATFNWVFHLFSVGKNSQSSTCLSFTGFRIRYPPKLDQIAFIGIETNMIRVLPGNSFSRFNPCVRLNIQSG